MGWLTAAVILVVRGDHRVRNVSFLAIVIALVIYAGQLDTLVPAVLAMIVFIIVVLVARAVTGQT